MFAIEPVKPVPAQVRAFGVATWLYVVQHISPITQLIPCRLVSGSAVFGFRSSHVWNVAASEVWLGMTRLSVLGFGVPWPRSFSEKNAVWLVPSVTSATRTELLK